MDKNNEHNDKQAVSKAVAHEMESADTIFATEYIAPPPLFLAADPKHIKEEVENEEKDQKFSPAELTDQVDQKNSPDPIGADLKNDSATVKANATVKEDEKEEEIMDGPAVDLIFADDSPEPPNDEGEEENGAASGGDGGGSDDDNPIQKKEGNSTSSASSSTSGNGVPAEVMSKMEASIGADFSNVEINANSSKAKDSGALAFAQGNKVHFAPGQFNPTTSSGQKLLGHELAHVKQQREGKVKPTTSVNGMSVNDDPKLEKAADIAGEKAANFKPEQQISKPKIDDSSLGQVTQKKIGPYKEGYQFPNNESQPVQGFFPLLALGAVALGGALGIGAGAAIYSTTDDHRERNVQNRFPAGILRDSVTGVTGSYEYVEGGSNLYLDDENREWRLLSDAKNVFHQPEGAPSGFSPNKKFLSFDTRGGSFEAILQPNPDGTYTNNWLNSGDRQGTYNYYDPDTAPVGHVLYDVLPHMVPGGGNYGNTPTAQQKSETDNDSATSQLKLEEDSTSDNPKSFSGSAKIMQQKTAQFFDVIQRHGPTPAADATPAPPNNSTPVPVPAPTPAPVPNESNSDQANLEENVCLPDGSTENIGSDIPTPSAAPTPEPVETPAPEQVVNQATENDPNSGVDWDKFWSDNGLNIARTVAEPFRLIPVYGLLPGFAADTMETIGDLQAAQPTNDEFIEIMIALRMPVVLFNNVVGHLLYIDELAQDAAIGSVLGVELVALTAPTAELLSSIRIGLLTAQTIIDGCVLAKSIMGMNSLASTPDEKKAYEDVFAGYDANLMMDGLDFILTGLDMGTGGLANGSVIGQFMRVGKNIVKRKHLFSELAQNVIIAWAGVWGGNAVGAVTSSGDPAQPKMDSDGTIQKKDGETSLPREVAAQIILAELNKIEGAYNLGTGILDGTADQLEFVLDNVNELSEKLTDQEALPLLKSGMIKGLDYLLGQLQGIQQTQPFITSAEEKTVSLHEFLDSAEKTLQSLELPEVSVGDIPMVPGFMEDLAEGGVNLIIENLNTAINEVKEMGFGAIQAMRENATELGTFLHTLTQVLDEQMDFISTKIEEFREFVNSIDSLEDIGDVMLAEISQLLGLDPPLTVESVKAGWEDLNQTIRGGFEMARNMVDEDVRGNTHQGKFEDSAQLKESQSPSPAEETITPFQLKQETQEPVVQKFDWTFGIGGAIDDYKQDHYDRNQFNQAPQQEPVDDPNWRRLPDNQSIYHQNGADGAGNRKYVSTNGGNFEAVYDSNGQLVTDDANMGTYNYSGPDDTAGHLIDDVVPYWLFGNNENDDTPLVNRIAGPRIMERTGDKIGEGVDAAGDFLGGVWNATGGQLFGGSGDTTQQKSEEDIQMKSDHPAQLMIGDEEEEEEIQLKRNNVQLKEDANIDNENNKQHQAVQKKDNAAEKPSPINDAPSQLKATDIIPSGVNVHTESSKATEMGALAFAQGSDIHFAPGQFKPNTRAGQELIGHELGHIVQQKEGRVQPTTQLKGVNVNNDKGLEKEADDFGVKFADSLQNKSTPVAQGKFDSGFSINKPSLQKKENPNLAAPLQMKEAAGAGGGGGSSEGSGPISVNGSQTGVKDLMASSPLPLFTKIKTTPASINSAMNSESTELKGSFPNIQQPTGIENQPVTEGAGQETTPTSGPHDTPSLGYAGQGGAGETTVSPVGPVNQGPNADLPTSQVTAMPPSPVPTVNGAPPSTTNITIGDDTVDYSAGTRPDVDTSGEADPSQMTTQETSDTSKVQGELTTANQDIGKDHGENDIYPHYDELEQLTPEIEIPQGQQLAIPEMEELTERRAEVDAAFNMHAQPKLNEDMAEHVAANEAEVAKMNQGSQEEWTTYETSKTEEEARVKAEQETAQNNAQTEVDTQKQNWQTENDAVKEKFASDASLAKAEYQGKIDSEITTADTSVEATLTQAEIDAQTQADLAQTDADQKEKEAEEKKSGGFFGWLADKVSKALDWLKDRFNEIIDALKTAVDAIIDIAKRAANTIIEAARRAITGLIRAFGAILKTFVDIAFAAFPEIRDRIKNVIDTAVDTAVEIVNTLADGLKDFVNALLDALGAALKFLLDAYQAYINFLIDAIKFITVGLFKIFQFITNLVVGAWKAPPQFFGCLAEDALGGNPGEPLKDIEVPNGQEDLWAKAMGLETADGDGLAGDEEGLSAEVMDLLTKGELSESDVTLEPNPAVELSPTLLAQLASLQDGQIQELGGAGGDSVSTQEFQASAADAAGYDLSGIDPSLLDPEAVAGPEGEEGGIPNPDFKTMSDEAKLQYYLDQMLPETEQAAAQQPSPEAAGKEASNSETTDAALIAKTGRLGVGQRLAFMGKQMLTGMKVFWNTYKAWIIGGLVTALIAAGAIAFFTGGAGLALAVDIILKAMIVIFGAIAIAKASGHVWEYVKHAWAGNTDAAGKSLAMACAVLVNEFLVDKILMGMGKVFRRTMKAIKASRVGRAAARVVNVVRKGTQGGSKVVRRGISAIKNSRLVVKLKSVIGRGVDSFMDLRRRILEKFGFDRMWFEKVNKYVELWASFNPKILLMRMNTDTDQIEVEDIDAVAPNTSNLAPKTGDTLPNGTTMGAERIGRSSTAIDADGASSVIVSDDFMRRINDPSLSPADRQAILQELKARVDAGDYHAIREFVEAQGALKFNREEFLEMFPGQEKVADAIEARHQLRSNMGDLPDLDIPYEAHHLIPVEVLKSTDADGILMRMAIEGGFDFNSALNGRWAAKYSESLGLGGIHASHPQYTSQIQLAIQKRAAQLDIDEITADIAREEIEKILKEIQYAFDNNLQLENPIKLNDLDLDLTSTPVRGVSRNAFLNSAEQLAKDPVFGNEMYDLWVKQDWAEIERVFTERAIKYPPNQGFVDITEVALKVDTVIDRYGGFIDDAGDFQDYGRFVAPDSAPFDSRALPDDSLSKPYRRYRVVKEIPSVGAGQAIPWFGKPGLGTQYLFQKSINELLEEGFIELLD
ncbi:eCIS core domain-containing protein [Portibacter lacus]|uniref:DUF4157 domain-containing protein n=1 Tax=Portibacter lacus TaxID=1099794 RepID=A0AA37SRN4_9BACT|nr:DUF4157 domain-containing protein [Portibacter lacus]GLR16685.1 hypothetical protein GCM10007940_13000 [Portibacter lacus]